MKNSFSLLILLTLLSFISCKENIEKKAGLQEPAKEVVLIDAGENFEEIDFTELNATLIKSKSDPTPEAIMKMHYPTTVERGEGDEQISVTRHAISDHELEIKLLHENLFDDSMKSEKRILHLKRLGNRWLVLSAKRNWKCWEGRGHADWGIEQCS